MLDNNAYYIIINIEQNVGSYYANGLCGIVVLWILDVDTLPIIGTYVWLYLLTALDNGCV